MIVLCWRPEFQLFVSAIIARSTSTAVCVVHAKLIRISPMYSHLSPPLPLSFSILLPFPSLSLPAVSVSHILRPCLERGDFTMLLFQPPTHTYSRSIRWIRSPDSGIQPARILTVCSLWSSYSSLMYVWTLTDEGLSSLVPYICDYTSHRWQWRRVEQIISDKGV